MEKPGLFAKLKTWSKKKKIIAGVLIVIILGGAYSVWGRDKSSGPLMVRTDPLQKSSIMESILLKAPLEGAESVEVVSRLHYEILALQAQEGDRVAKGQVLAVLDSEKLQDEVDKATDTLALITAQTEEKLQSNQRAYEQAAKSLTSAEKNYERTKALHDSGAESLSSLETAEQSLQDAKRKLAEFQVDNGVVVLTASEQKQIDITRKDLAQKQKDLAEAEIKSPIDGTVTRVNVKVGRFADDTDDDKPMFIIENLDQLQMDVLVSEFDIAKVKIDQKVNVTADILQGDVVGAVVERISPTGELKDNSSTERVIPTRIKIVEADSRLIAGINARAEIIINQADDVFIVPQSAVIQNEDGEDTIAIVTEENTVHWIQVTLGIKNDLDVSIQSEELVEGMSVISSPAASLTEGTSVTTPATS